MTPTIKRHSTKQRFIFYFFFILVIAALLRILMLFNSFVYDEIWSLHHFSTLSFREIIFQVALPNNHPLNTLWIKLFSESPFAFPCIRLFSVVCGILSVVLTGFLAWTMSGGRKNAALWGMTFLCAASPLIVYSQLARGYSPQLFFLLLFASGLAASELPFKIIPLQVCSLMIFIGGLASALTLSTSVVYMAAIFTAYLLICRKVPARPVFFTLCITAVIGGAYYFKILPALLSARSWGTKINSAQEFAIFTVQTFGEIFTVAGTLAAAAALYWNFKRTCALLTIPAIVMISGIFTHAGPPRVYLPLIAVLSVLGGVGMSKLLEKSPQKLRFIFIAGILLAIAAGTWGQYDSWRFPNWFHVFEENRKTSPHTLFVYKSGDGYTYTMNNTPDFLQDYLSRIESNAVARTLVLYEENGFINGMDAYGNEKKQVMGVFGSPIQGSELSGYQYPISRKNKLCQNDAPVIATFFHVPEDVYRKQIIGMVSHDHFLLLNNWLSSSYEVDGKTFRSFILYGRDNPHLLQILQRLRSTSTCGVAIYEIKDRSSQVL